MASISCRSIARSSFSSIRSAFRSNGPKPPKSTASFPLPPKLSPSSTRRLSFSRTPSELGCVASMLPLHNAVAGARMTSRLSDTSRSCRSLSQGTLCCTSPGL